MRTVLRPSVSFFAALSHLSTRSVFLLPNRVAGLNDLLGSSKLSDVMSSIDALGNLTDYSEKVGAPSEDAATCVSFEREGWIMEIEVAEKDR